MTEGFQEFREVFVTDPLRQGDILESVNEGAPVWQRRLVVITADCDLANKKNHRRVTCLPLLPAESYLYEFHLPSIRTRFVEKILSDLAPQIKRHSGASISKERLREWPKEMPPQQIVQILKLPDKMAISAEAAFEAIRIVDAPCVSLKDSFDALIDANLAQPNSQKPETFAKSLTERLKAPFSQPPGDALFISSIATRNTDGYFAYLRHMEQISESVISTGPTRSKVDFRRISRLQDRFTHALVQKFAMVFMAIGLPTEYEETRDMHAQVLGETIA